jgi:CubicO group peptidase (beta-lactamase class C family)
LADQIDALFAPWDRPDAPGCALGVIRDGELMYARGYGMANLDDDLPITPDSAFQIASMSKQFTAASVLLLAQRGALALDDEVRRYVPEIPDYGTTITLRHLLHHTSGLRSVTSLMGLAGQNFEGFYTNADMIALLARQKALDFVPGAEHVYCNSGYVLLAEVVARASGRSLREFAQENIFDPLGMAHTRFSDDHSAVVKNRVISYAPRSDGSYRRFVKNDDVLGSTGVVSTVNDLYRWDRNFYEPKVGDVEFLAQMLAPGVLNDGQRIHYACGIAHGAYRGLKIVWHGGLELGFRSQMMRFPAQRFTVICLANQQGFAATRLIQRVADLFLADVFPEPALTAAQPMPISERQLAEILGVYLHPATGFNVALIRRGETLFAEIFGAAIPMAAVGVSAHTLLLQELAGPLEMDFKLERAAQGRPWRLNMTISMHRPPTLHPIAVVSPAADELAGYAGAFYSAELDVTYEIAVEDGRLTVWYAKEPPFPLQPALADVFRAGSGAFFFERDAEGKVAGLRVTDPLARNIRFARKG